MTRILPWLVVSMVFYAAGEYLSKRYSLCPGWAFAVAAVACYCVTSAAWLPAINSLQSLTLASMVWNVSYSVTGVAIGLFLFGEHITAVQGAGLVMGVCGIILMLL